MTDWRDIEPEPCFNCTAVPMTGYYPTDDFARNMPKKARCPTKGCPFGLLVLSLPKWNELMEKARKGR